LVSSIGKGICVLVGIHKDDTEADANWMVNKLLNLRIFSPGEDRWQSSVKDLNLEILCVSQFTLYSVLKGNKPDFHGSMKTEPAREFFTNFVAKLRTSYKEDLVKEGSFGNYSAVSLVNDGPVTITLDSPKIQVKGKTNHVNHVKEVEEEKQN